MNLGKYDMEKKEKREPELKSEFYLIIEHFLGVCYFPSNIIEIILN